MTPLVRHKHLVTALALVAALATACHKTAPQRPTRLHEAPKADTAMLGMMAMNERMAVAADRRVKAAVDSCCRAENTDIEHRWIKLESGAWLRREDCHYTTDTLTLGERRLIRLTARRLDGSVIADRESVITVGRRDLPAAVDEIMTELHEGEQRIIIAPWYAAYGPAGDDAIPGYENIWIELWIKQRMD